MQIPNILEFPLVRVFLAIDDPRSGIPIYDYETIDEPADGGKMRNADRVELGEKENTTAEITDFGLLKVIGKGTFGKVGRLSACEHLPKSIMYNIDRYNVILN